MVERTLARAFLAGEPIVELVIERATRTLGRAYRWLPRLARAFVKTFPPARVRPRLQDVVRFLRRDPVFSRALPKLNVEQWLIGPQRMHPVSAAEGWPIPPIETVGASPIGWNFKSPTWNGLPTFTDSIVRARRN
jgi:hypothetical protein